MNDVKLNFINNQWIDSGVHKESINPSTGEVLGVWAEASVQNVQDAINTAAKTFRESEWKGNRRLRAKVLNEMADRFDEHRDKIIKMLSLENGKVIQEATFELLGTSQKLRYFAALALTNSGRAMETAPGAFSMVVTQPIGVAGIIVPWNSPVILLIRSLAPALAAGCTAVIKMPSSTALVNNLVSEVFAATKSLPPGVCNLFTEGPSGKGSPLLIEDKNVATISYTGSTKVGKILAENMGKTLKRYGLELGGKAPMILFDDANLEQALPVLEKGITLFAGQFCMTGSRILVQKGIAEKVRRGLAERLEKVKVGPGIDPSSDMGPMIDKANVDRVDAVVQKAIAEGAKVITRGGPVRDGELAKGAFYRPTLLEVSDNKMAIVQDETFGPVATLQVFETEAEAVALANDSIYGLSASVWSTDVDIPLRVARDLDAGTVWVNDWAQVDDEFEEGGFKMSGPGRLNGEASLREFQEIKHIYHNSKTIKRN